MSSLESLPIELPLRKKPILNLDKLHGRGAFLVIIGDVVDPRAHGKAPHQPSIVGLEQVGCRSGSPSCPLDTIPQRRTSEEIDSYFWPDTASIFSMTKALDPPR
jgi:hypothetical protein